MIKPDIAIITNIGKAHIGKLGSIENILKAKLEILEGLADKSQLILNGDDELLTKANIKFNNIDYVGVKNKNITNLYANNIESSMKNLKFDINGKICTIPILGEFNVINTLLAIKCAQKFNIEIEDSIKYLKQYIHLPARNEVYDIKGIKLIKDYYSASPESIKEAINLLASVSNKSKKILVLGQINDLGVFSKKEHIDIAKLCIKNKIDYVFFIGEDYVEFKKVIGTKKGQFFSTENKDLFSNAIIEYISSNIKNDDIILVKGARNLNLENIYEDIKNCINSIKSNNIIIPNQQTKLYVDIDAIKYNYKQIKNEIGSNIEIMPMIKANSYGAGTEIISNVFRNCNYLAVADIKEAALLKNNLPNSNILVIYQPSFSDITNIIKNDYIVAVSNIEFLKKLNEISKLYNKVSKVHIEIDSGAARLGINLSECKEFANEIIKLKNIEVEGIFTHYICAETMEKLDLEFTKMQTEIFEKCYIEIESIIGKIKYKHACSSSAIFNPNAKLYNMVRPGYMLYGYYSDETLKSKVKLKPSLKLASTIIQIKEYDKDTPISYNRRFITERKTKIATISIGYSDGIFRSLFNLNKSKNGAFVVNGQLAPIVGSICMDLTMIDVTDIIGDIKVNDEVFIFDNINMTIEKMASITSTIGYEIITKIEDKTQRIELF